MLNKLCILNESNYEAHSMTNLKKKKWSFLIFGLKGVQNILGYLSN